jgi:hypothetical protein
MISQILFLVCLYTAVNTLTCNPGTCGERIAFFINPCFQTPCPTKSTCLAQACTQDSNDKCSWQVIMPRCIYPNGTTVPQPDLSSITTVSQPASIATSLSPSATSLQPASAPTNVDSSNSLRNALSPLLLFVFII